MNREIQLNRGREGGREEGRGEGGRGKEKEQVSIHTHINNMHM